jgi:hypothetical protein
MFLAVPVGGAILWVVVAGVREKENGDAARPQDRAKQTNGSPTRKRISPDADPDKMEARESSRHKSGEFEKHQDTPLEKKVAEQERRVEESRKVLPTLTTAGEMSFQGGIVDPPSIDSNEQTLKKDQAAQQYEEAKQKYLAERKLLNELKKELAEEQTKPE